MAFITETMSKDDVNDIAIQWAKNEGWNPGINDTACFYAQDPHGFFVGRLDGKAIGCCSSVIYDEKFAFFGFYIVDKTYRYQGYGIQMTQHRLRYVGERNLGLDGVLDMCDKYANLGFRTAHLNIRYQGQGFLTHIDNPAIIPINESLIAPIIEYDQHYFPAKRPNFLTCWLKQNTAKSYVYLENNTIKGYGVIRRCFSGYKIGPLFSENSTIANLLFQKLASHANEQAIYLDVPEPNNAALQLVIHYKMQPCFKTNRMYTKKAPDIDLDKVYGITTFELG